MVLLPITLVPNLLTVVASPIKYGDTFEVGRLFQIRQLFKHEAILYNEAEVFSLSITNPNGRTMLGLFTQV